MSNRKLPILVAGAFLLAAAPAMAQGTTTNTTPAKPTGRSDVKSDGAVKAKTLPNGAEAEGRSGATDAGKDTTTSGTAR